MSLIWDITGCKDPDGLYEKRVSGGHEYDALDVVTEIIIWMSIPVGLNRITEANIDEWDTRARMLERTGETYLIRTDTADDGAKTVTRYNPSRADFERRIGLFTNASVKNEAQFNKDVVQWLRDSVERERRWTKEEVKA